MAGREIDRTVPAMLADEECHLSLAELCRACGLPAEHVIEFVEHGLLEPRGSEPRQWRFCELSVRRVYRAQRLERDLGVNVAGAALALDLLDELERLRARVRRLER